MPDSTAMPVHLTTDELMLMNNALNEILHGPEAIAHVEFQTRTGATPQEAKALLAKVSALLKAR